MDSRSSTFTDSMLNPEARSASARGLETLDISRISIAMDGLLLAEEVLYMDLGERLVRVGHLPGDLVARGVARLIVTSTRMGIGGGDLWVRCSRCRQMLPLLRVGLRYLSKADEVRNQPRCGPCRRDPYR